MHLCKLFICQWISPSTLLVLNVVLRFCYLWHITLVIEATILPENNLSKQKRLTLAWDLNIKIKCNLRKTHFKCNHHQPFIFCRKIFRGFALYFIHHKWVKILIHSVVWQVAIYHSNSHSQTREYRFYFEKEKKIMES